MNSVLQQLYMVPAVRVGILKAHGAATNDNEDFSGDSDMSSGGIGPSFFAGSSTIASMSSTSSTIGGDDATDVRKNYHVIILKHVQAIFAHLGHSALQFYVPRGLWTHFK